MGILTILAGVLPFFKSMGILPAAIPASGTLYYVIIIVIGVLTVIYGAVNPGMALFGTDLFVVIAFGILVVCGGILPFITNLGILTFIPTEGIAYTGIIAGIGAIGTLYGALKQF